MSKHRFLYHLTALTVSAVWGVTFVSTKVLINAGMQPMAIFAVRFLVAYAGIWLFSLPRPEARRVWSRTWKDELVFLFLGITGGSLYFLMENTALAHTQASNVSFLVCSAPLFTALLTLLWRKIGRGRFVDGLEDIRAGWPLLLGTLLALSGMALLVFDGSRVHFSAKGDLLAVGAALCWAFYSLFMGEMTHTYGSVFATRKVFFYGLLTILPMAGTFGESLSPSILFRPEVILNLLFLGLIASLAGFIAWNLAMDKLGNVTSTNYVYMNPVFTLVFAVAFLGERMTLSGALGSLAILAGVFLAGLRRPEDKPEMIRS
ncbi:MAG: DMT family transporter [Bacteroidales bacterium]|nr:DMT family transporter [Bacteroidales bacterium]